MIDFKKRRFLLYGLGISLEAVRNYFDKHGFTYETFIDSGNTNQEFTYSKDVIVIKSPGIPNDTHLMIYLKNNKNLIWSDINLFYLLNPNKVYTAVTGTVGKTSTVLFLNQCIKNSEYCGNIGFPIFNTKKNHLIVECSSYMLEYSPDFHPNDFIVLNLFPHHLNHHLSYIDYVKSKLRPIYSMNKNDLLIFKTNYNLNLNDFDSVKNNLLPLWSKYNVNDKTLLECTSSFKRPCYRLEEVYNDGKLIIVNDSKSTCLEATNYAVSKYHGKNIYLIMGGKIDYLELNNTDINLEDVKILYLYGENKDILRNKVKLKNVYIFNNLSDLMKSVDIKDGIVLFSPGSQSLDQYSSFEKRGKHFNELVEKYIKNQGNI